MHLQAIMQRLGLLSEKTKRCVKTSKFLKYLLISISPLDHVKMIVLNRTGGLFHSELLFNFGCFSWTSRLDAKNCKRINLGGCQAAVYLQRLLQLKYPGHFAAITLSRMEEILHEHSYIAEDYTEGRTSCNFLYWSVVLSEPWFCAPLSLDQVLLGFRYKSSTAVLFFLGGFCNPLCVRSLLAVWVLQEFVKQDWILEICSLLVQTSLWVIDFYRCQNEFILLLILLCASNRKLRRLGLFLTTFLPCGCFCISVLRFPKLPRRVLMTSLWINEVLKSPWQFSSSGRRVVFSSIYHMQKSLRWF